MCSGRRCESSFKYCGNPMLHCPGQEWRNIDSGSNRLSFSPAGQKRCLSSIIPGLGSDSNGLLLRRRLRGHNYEKQGWTFHHLALYSLAFSSMYGIPGGTVTLSARVHVVLNICPRHRFVSGSSPMANRTRTHICDQLVNTFTGRERIRRFPLTCYSSLGR
jgi:hypothetical protein